MKGNKTILILIFIYFVILSSQIYICYDRITGRSTSGSGQVSITILPSCPEIYPHLSDMTVKVGDVVNFTVCAKYGTPPFYFTHNSTFMDFISLEGNCATVSFHAEGYLKGNHYVEFTVTDGRCTDSQVIKITITENLPPGGGGGGGGGGGLVCIPDWNCTEWSACSPQAIQTRICSMNNDCTTFSKPSEIRACVYTPITTPECTTRADCPKNKTCIDGGCYRITCKKAKDCPADMTCKDGLCSEWECSKDSECASDENCKEHLCLSKAVSAKPFFLQTNICEIPAWLALLIIIMFSLYAYTFYKYYDLTAEESKQIRNLAVTAVVSYIAFLILCIITFFICPNWMLYGLLILFSVFFTTASIGFKKSKSKNWFAFWYFGVLALLSIIFCTLVYLMLNGAKIITINPLVLFLFVIGIAIALVMFWLLYKSHK
jgi:hypothetical protein